MNLTLLTLVALQYMNVPYRWGGNGFLGLDCSGFALKTFNDVGLTLPDMTANDLMKYCQRNGTKSLLNMCDELIFFGKGGKATHVGISLGMVDGVWMMIHAGGGGSWTEHASLKQIEAKDARVKISPVDYRKDRIAAYIIPYRKSK